MIPDTEDSMTWSSSKDPEDSGRSCYSYVPKGERLSVDPEMSNSGWSTVSVRSRFGDSMRSTTPRTPRSITPREVVPDKEIKYFKDTIFVGGLPHNAHRDDVIARFSKFGKIKKIVWPMVHDKKLNRKRPKGFAYVIFRENEDAQKVLKAHEKVGIYLEGFPESKLGIDRKRDNTALTAQVRARRADLGLPERDSGDAQRETETYVAEDGKTYIKCMLFLGNVPHEATREDIEKMFSEYGQIKKIVWPQTLDKSMGIRRHKGFCYVIFFSPADSLKAIAAAKANAGHLEIFGTKMVVEAKLDRPLEGEQGRSPRPLGTPTRGSNGEMSFEQLYHCEKAKNERLQAVVREQRRTIQRLERSNSRRGESSMESSMSKRLSRTREASVCAVDSTRNSRKAAVRSSPIPGRWSRARIQRETASKPVIPEAETEVAIPLTTQSMPHPLLAKRQASKKKIVLDFRSLNSSAFSALGRAKSMESSD